MKMYADKRANAKPSPIRVLLCQEKKSKLSTPFEGIPYTDSKDRKKRTQAALANRADVSIVASKPWSTVDVADQT